MYFGGRCIFILQDDLALVMAQPGFGQGDSALGDTRMLRELQEERLMLQRLRYQEQLEKLEHEEKIRIHKEYLSSVPGD